MWTFDAALTAVYLLSLFTVSSSVNIKNGMTCQKSLFVGSEKSSPICHCLNEDGFSF